MREIREMREIRQYSSVRAEQYEFPVCRDVASESSTKVDGRSILLTEPYWEIRRFLRKNLPLKARHPVNP